MSNIDKRALREAAEKATPGPWGIARDDKTITSNQSHPVAVVTEAFHRMLANGTAGGDAEYISQANPATVLALLDELEAKDKSISFLKDQLAQLANFNPDWDKLEAATDSLREHMAELTAARKRIAELSHHLQNAHEFIEHTEAFGYEASNGILCCGDAQWNIDASKSALAAAGKGEAS